MSNRTEMASPKTLREWCRCTCANYPDVEIRNMSTSFRDGLAFCAIIHKHRPDLIDFSSLSKDNVYQNNKLAFETAERKLGLPALLDPKDLVSNKVPDSLSVITYISQYYHFFNRKSYGLPSLKSPHVTFLNNLTKSKTPDGLKPLKNLTDLETGREDRLSNTRPCTVCSLCFKPVHLIQRHLMDGKVFHRSCFRCKVCHSTLLPGSYTQRSEDGSLICSHHITDSTSVELNQQVTPPEILPKFKFVEGYVSLGGLAVTSVPYYGKITESAHRLVYKTPEMEGKEKQERSSREDSADGVKSVEKKPAPPLLPPPIVKDGTVEGGGAAPILAEDERQQEATHSSELSTPCIRVTEEGSSRPVPAPRRILDSVPVPAPRIKTAPTTKSASAAGNSSIPNKCSPNSSHISPSRGNPKVQSNHPWITIIHPGPWTQLPPAPPPVPTPRSKSGFNQRRTWYKPRVPAPNPFGEEEEEEEEEGGEGGEEDPKEDPKEEEGARPEAVEQTGDTSQLSLSDLDETGKTGGSPLDVTEAEAGTNAISDETQSHILPRSLSVPAITSDHSQSSLSSFDLTEETESDQVMSSSSKVACKENPFDRKPGLPKSKTFQTLQSARAPAPGHGFPLIKRKVQTDQNASSAELDKHLEDLEQRGVEMERNLRDYKNDKEEEQMLMEWFSLNHERHILVCRGTELFYLTKQQKLEERQADVEYELRCLLNKPESDWSEEDRGRERQLMDELVAVIEQRNQIVGSLDQDRQRESEEDMHLEAMRKNKDFQKCGLKELQKSKGKFKPAKMFKMLNHKAESNKDSVDKKS